MTEAITKRRSIRKFKTDSVPDDMINEIIMSGTLAPSAKNRQPWEFVVVTGRSKDEMAEIMESGLEREKIKPLLPGSVQHIADAEHTLNIMRQAPAVIFVVNPLGIDLEKSLTPEERVYEICNMQSIGAAIENMSLTAVELGLGSLWICNTYFAYAELREWLGAEPAAALAVGHADESPNARPRKPFETIVSWRK